jgi:hypothetical protein
MVFMSLIDELSVLRGKATRDGLEVISIQFIYYVSTSHITQVPKIAFFERERR